MKFRSLVTWVACLVVLLCSACGQKGKLVMPVRPPPVSTPYPTALPDDADADKDDATKDHATDNNQAPAKN